MVTIKATRENAVRGNARLTNYVVAPQRTVDFEISKSKRAIAHATHANHSDLLSKADKIFISENITHPDPKRVTAALAVKFPSCVNTLTITPKSKVNTLTDKLPAIKTKRFPASHFVNPNTPKISLRQDLSVLPPVRQVYLDKLMANTNNLDLVERKYIQQLNTDIDESQLQVQSSFFNNEYVQRLVLNMSSHFDEKYIVKLVEDVFQFVVLACEKVEGLSRLRCIYRATTIFLKLRFNESMYHIVKDRAIPYITQIMGEFFVQSDDLFSSAREMLNSYKNINDSPIMIKLYKCAMYIMSLSIFDKIGVSLDTFGYSKLEQAALKKRFYKKSDFIYVLFDTILFIAERGYQVYITGDIMSIFHSGGEYKSIFDKCRILQRRKNLLTNPEEHGFTESEFRSDLDNCIEKLESIAKHSFRLDKTDINMIRSMLNEMLIVRDDINTKSSARRNRKAPFGVLIAGDSGIGKTSVTSMLSIVYAKHKKLPGGSEFRYTRNPGAKHWDGFVSSCHTVVLDDVANEAPELGKAESVNEIIQIMNNQAFCPDQAALEAKGTTPFKAKLVIATTNVKNLNAFHYFSCPSAVQRRFPFIITPSVRKEYKDERGMLNSSMVKDLGPFPDLWLFTIELVRPVPLSEGKRWAKMEILHENLNLKELLKWYISAIDTFDEDQTKVAKCVASMESVELCICCSLPDTMCESQIQSDTVSLLQTISYAYLLTVFCFLANLFYKSKIYQNLNFAFNVYCKYRNNAAKARYYTYNFYNKLSTAEHWTAMGERMKTKLKHPQALLSLATVATATYALYKITNKLNGDPQSHESQDVGTVPISELNGRENVWYNNTLDLSVANFTRESSSSKGMEFSQFCAKISKNVAYIEILKPNTEKSYVRSRMTCLGGHIWLVNNHCIPSLDTCTIIKVVLDNKLGISNNMSFTLSEADIHRVPATDLAFMTLRELPPMKKIVSFFQIGKSNGIFNGAYASRSEKGESYINPVKKIVICKERSFKFPSHNIDSKHVNWQSHADRATTAGECGSPLIIESSYGYSIVGIHFLASTTSPNEAYATSVQGDFITAIYEKLSSFNVESGDFTLVSSDSAPRIVSDLHKKSVFRYLNDGSANIYGSFTDFRGKSKSSVVNTPMSTFLLEKGYAIKYTKPEMRSWVPWHTAAKDLVKPITTLDTGILNICVKSYINDVMANINPDNIKDMLLPLDNFTAINGAQVAYIDKINRNTSAGNPWKKSKKYFMTSSEPEHGMMDPVIVDDEIMNRVDDIIRTYREGRQAHPNFCAHLKDEPVTFKKASIGKTRVFTGAAFDWTIVVRKFLLSFSRLQQNERFAFEAAPGTVAQSLEWQELYEYIVKFGEDRIVAGDYKAFDKKMTPKEILAAFDVIIFFCEQSGNYTADDIKCIRGIAEDTAFAVVDYNGDLIQLLGSNPSGHPLTVVINGIVNSLRMRYAYFSLRPENCARGFKDSVNLMTYGDDNIMSVHKSCDWFNHTAIAEQFASLDIIYTMADKEAKSVPFINISEGSFLKRIWKYDEDMGCMLAPLDHDSIEKMMMTWCASKSVCSEAQGISVITTAMREYFYYGRDIYEQKLDLFQNLVVYLGWELFVEESTFLTYEELKALYKISSKKCVSYRRTFLSDE